MSIWDKLNVEDRNYRRIDQFRAAPSMTASSEKMEEDPVFNGFTYMDTYQLNLTASVAFCANKAQYESRREAALQQVKNFLFADLKGHLQAALNAAHSGDKDETFAMIQLALEEINYD